MNYFLKNKSFDFLLYQGILVFVFFFMHQTYLQGVNKYKALRDTTLSFKGIL